MIKLSDSIKRMLNALAYAHGAEYLTPQQKSQAMFGGPTPTIPMEAAPLAIELTPAQTSRPRIGLYLGSELPAELMHYVIQTCNRLRHDLAVLTFQGETEARALLKPYQNELEEAHIGVQLAVLTGEPPTALVQAVRKRSEIAFLVCNESGYLGRGLMKGIVRQDAFPIPVVIVAAGGTAISKPEQAETPARRNA